MKYKIFGVVIVTLCNGDRALWRFTVPDSAQLTLCVRADIQHILVFVLWNTIYISRYNGRVTWCFIQYDLNILKQWKTYHMHDWCNLSTPIMS